MKPSQISSLFLLLTISSIFFSPAAPIAPPVLDIDGHALFSGVKYYILPVHRGRGGGVTLSFTGRANGNASVSRCPLDVVQESSELKSGLPVVFSPMIRGVIRQATDLNIKFWASTTCAQSTVWKVSGFEKATQKYFITTGGVEGSPGAKTLSNWFKIEKIGEKSYRLVFCPMVCKFCKVMCKDVGFYSDRNGFRRLALTEDFPLVVQFKKA